MKKGKGNMILDGEHINCSCGGDPALVYEDFGWSEQKRFEEDCRKVDVALRRFASGAIARTSEKFAPCGTTNG